jgi:hypothetical protein
LIRKSGSAGPLPMWLLFCSLWPMLFCRGCT